MLKFFGSEAGFGDEHTSAYFITKDNELVVIDCPVSAHQKLKKKPFEKYKDIYILITHTHIDHVAGVGLFAQFAFFNRKRTITIVTPSSELAKEIDGFMRFVGNEPSWYKIITVSELKEKEWFRQAILTEHSPQLKGKCFGYQLYVDGKNCVYTGDTCTLEPFMPYLKAGTQLYVDVSVKSGVVHLKLEDAIPILRKLTKNGVKVWLMHLDDFHEAARILDNTEFTRRELDIILPSDWEQ